MKKTLIPTLAACLLLGGCMTGIMWERMAGDQYEFAADESDNITAFAVATADSSQLKKGSLILVGEKYWYVLDQGEENTRRLAQLRAQFPKAFSFKSKGNLEANKRYKNNTFVLERREEEKGSFRSEYCLSYQTDNPAEAKQLAALGFDKKPDGYETCSAVTGKMYAVGNLKVPAEYRFESRLPVQLGRSYGKSAPAGNKVAAALLTPLALAADAVATVTVYPIMFRKAWFGDTSM
jgi:membrane protein